MVRGIINNNPANIRRGSSWKGLSSVQNDRSFCQFISMSYGIRAFFCLMRTYRNKYNLITIDEVLHRFAPDSENDTHSYIQHCSTYIRNHGYDNCDITGQSYVNVWFNTKEPSDILRVFARSVFLMETGYEFSENALQKGINLI